MGRIVVISGPVGAGKTTIARELIAVPQGPTVYIEGDAFWPFIVQPRPEGRQESFRTTMRAMFDAALAYARAEYEVLLDFSVPPQFLDGARAKIKDASFHDVVLPPSEAICAARAATVATARSPTTPRTAAPRVVRCS